MQNLRRILKFPSGIKFISLLSDVVVCNRRCAFSATSVLPSTMIPTERSYSSVSASQDLGAGYSNLKKLYLLKPKKLTRVCTLSGSWSNYNPGKINLNSLWGDDHRFELSKKKNFRCRKEINNDNDNNNININISNSNNK